MVFENLKCAVFSRNAHFVIASARFLGPGVLGPGFALLIAPGPVGALRRRSWPCSMGDLAENPSHLKRNMASAHTLPGTRDDA